jgi:hypothetical protein
MTDGSTSTVGTGSEGEGDLALRVAKFQAIEDIRRLKLVYAKHCDSGYPPEILAAMFTEDAVWEGGRFGTHRGRPAIYDFFAGISSDMVFAMHFMIGDTITVADDVQTAKGSWQLLQLCSLVVDGEKQSMLLSGHYFDEYRREDDGWKFSNVELVWNIQARTDVGWAEERLQL